MHVMERRDAQRHKQQLHLIGAVSKHHVWKMIEKKLKKNTHFVPHCTVPTNLRAYYERNYPKTHG
jgi:hypothetical protein